MRRVCGRRSLGTREKGVYKYVNQEIVGRVSSDRGDVLHRRRFGRSLRVVWSLFFVEDVLPPVLSNSYPYLPLALFPPRLLSLILSSPTFTQYFKEF